MCSRSKPGTGSMWSKTPNCSAIAALLQKATRSSFPCPLRSEHQDFRGARQQRLTEEQCVAVQTSRGQPAHKGLDKTEVVPVMHGNSDLGSELLQDPASGLRTHRIEAIDRDQRHIDASNLVQLLGGEWMAQIAQVDDAERAEIEDEG